MTPREAAPTPQLIAAFRAAYIAFADRCDVMLEGEDMSAAAFYDAWKQEVEPRIRAAVNATDPEARKPEATPRSEMQGLAAWLRAQCPNYAMQERCETCGYSKAAHIVEQYDPEALARLRRECVPLLDEATVFAANPMRSDGARSLVRELAKALRAALAGTP
jgi:rRNA maturation protein Nop10